MPALWKLFTQNESSAHSLVERILWFQLHMFQFSLGKKLWAPESDVTIEIYIVVIKKTMKALMYQLNDIFSSITYCKLTLI